jgi:hypothetical protein
VTETVEEKRTREDKNSSVLSPWHLALSLPLSSSLCFCSTNWCPTIQFNSDTSYPELLWSPR